MKIEILLFTVRAATKTSRLARRQLPKFR